MVDSRVRSPKSRRNSWDFDLYEFPPLGESVGAIAGASVAAVATAGTSVAGAMKAGLGSGTAWKLFDPSLVFFLPLEKNGRMKTANKLWGREGSVEIRFLTPSVYMINFPSQRVRDWVLESGPWHIQNRAIVLRRWMPGMIPEVLNLKKALVWVKFWHIPLELFSQTGLGYLASAIGKPLYTDKATVLKQQLEFAKVCVEVEASSTLPSSILVDLGEGNCVDVDVELELVWAPPRCSHCHVFGHLNETCGMLAQQGGTPMGDLQVDLGIDRGRREEVVGSVNKSGVDLVLLVDSGACVDVQATGIGVVENAQERDMSITEHREIGVVDSLVGSCVVQEDVMSGNSFDLLVDAADGQDDVQLSPKKSRLAAGGVADLLNQLKPKHQQKGKKKNGKGGAKNKENGGRGGETFGGSWFLLSLRLELVHGFLQGILISFVLQQKVRIIMAAKKLVRTSPSADNISREKEVARELNKLYKAEEKFLRQKSRIQYVKEGDQNSAYFFRYVTARQKANMVQVLSDENGRRLESFEAISSELIKHFQNSFGVVDPNVTAISDSLLKEILGVELSTEMADSLIPPITRKEIKDVLFAMNGNKAPGPDGS
ncbi:hypothetical protein V6N13_076067 [Hibiscus sabdariffa]